MRLKEQLIKNGYNDWDAEVLIAEAREDLQSRIKAEGFVDESDFMKEWFNLEPDWFDELLNNLLLG